MAESIQSNVPSPEWDQTVRFESDEPLILVRGQPSGDGLTLSYALFPSPPFHPRIATRTIVDKDRAEIIFNLPGLLDWSDQGVITGDTLGECFCASLQRVLLVRISDWAAGEIEKDRGDPDPWFDTIGPLVDKPFATITKPLCRIERRVKRRGNRVPGLPTFGLSDWLSTSDAAPTGLTMRVAYDCPSCGHQSVLTELEDYRLAWCQLCGCRFHFDVRLKQWISFSTSAKSQPSRLKRSEEQTVRP